MERTEARTTHRNGHRPRVLSTKAGDLALAIPKLRKGSLLPRAARTPPTHRPGLYAVVMEAYVNGVSTRSVDDLVAAMGVDTGGSRGPRCHGSAPASTNASPRPRPQPRTHGLPVRVPRRHLHQRPRRRPGPSRLEGCGDRRGITATGECEVLGVDIGDSEDETFWTRFLRSLRDRGQSGVRLVISDAHVGLKASIRKCFAGSSWQRCRVHFARNLLATISKAHTELVAAAFRSIFALGTSTEVAARWDEVTDPLAERFPKAAALMRDARTDVLAFTAFPRAHWRKVWSSNTLERLNNEVKLRSNVVGILPNDAAAIRLIGAVLAGQHDGWAIARRDLSEHSMAHLNEPRDTDPDQPAVAG